MPKSYLLGQPNRLQKKFKIAPQIRTTPTELSYSKAKRKRKRTE